MNRGEPIITSLLDTDFYIPLMGQFVFHNYPNVRVKYAFKNRTPDVLLGRHINERRLREELDNVRSLHFSNKEIEYLGGIEILGRRVFQNDYLEFLKTSFQPSAYEIRCDAENFYIEVDDLWVNDIYCEIPQLSITNELYFESLMNGLTKRGRDKVYAVGRKRLQEKIEILSEYPEIIFSDFGTRRRFAKLWQEEVVLEMAEKLPKQLVGTSNVYLAMKHGLTPVGTMAHKLFMVAEGLANTEEEILNSQNKILREWWNEYGYGLSVALIDTFGSDAFYRFANPNIARDYKGLRHDSGDNIAEGEKEIAWLEACGTNPKEKFAFFSDGLDVFEMIKIYKHLVNRIKIAYGVGTNFTNDLGPKAISIVVKPIEANGRGLVKLSNNIAKAIGRPEDIEKHKKVWGYTSTLNEPCRY
ncbi:MAG: nicotinate phosphoribosyltransferase [Parcubacteria group bacterium]|nr:nicotinate phosphoribosyltransferase [Parcubacteria group bacterium]